MSVQVDARMNDFFLDIDVLDVLFAEGDVRRLEDATKRIRDLTCFDRAGRHAREERWKKEIVSAIHDDDLEPLVVPEGPVERERGVKAGETAADDHDAPPSFLPRSPPAPASHLPAPPR